MDFSPGIVSALISAPIAILISLFSEPMRARIFRPKLQFIYEHNMDGFRVTNSEERVYIRVKVVNNSRNIAKSCKAYLVGVKSTPDWQNILYDFPQLNWPYMGPKEVDIRKSLDQFIDVAYSVKSLDDKNKTRLKFASSFTTSHLRALENKPEDCYVQIAVVTEQGYRADFSLKLIWRGSWDTFDAIPSAKADFP